MNFQEPSLSRRGWHPVRRSRDRWLVAIALAIASLGWLPGVPLGTAEARSDELPKAAKLDPDMAARLARVLAECTPSEGTTGGKPNVYLNITSSETTKLEEGDLAAVKFEPRITGIVLHGSFGTDEEIQHLEGLPQIQGLVLPDSPASDARMTRLARSLPNLSVLELFLNDPTNPDVEAIGQCLKLEHLGLPIIGRTNDVRPGLLAVARLPLLKELVLHSPDMNDEVLQVLSKSRRMQFLYLAKRDATDHNNKPIPPRSRWTDAGTRGLYAIKPLRKLKLYHPDLTNDSLIGIDQAKHLTIFYPPWGTGDAGLAEIARSQSIVSLCLNYHSKISDRGLRHIAKMKQLQELTLLSTPISNTGIAELQQMPNLKRISIRKTGVTNEVVEILDKFPALEKIEWSLTLDNAIKERLERIQSRNKDVRGSAPDRLRDEDY